MSNIEDRIPKQPPTPLASSGEDRPRFLSLRTKFSLFVSLVIVLVCTGLSGFLIQQEAVIMKRSMLNTGTILVNTLNKVSLNRLIIQDTDYLGKMLEGALSAPEVVYAIIRDQNGKMLVGKSKGILTNASEIIRDKRQPLLPNEAHTTPLFSQPPKSFDKAQPLITILHTVIFRGHDFAPCIKSGPSTTPLDSVPGNHLRLCAPSLSSDTTVNHGRLALFGNTKPIPNCSKSIKDHHRPDSSWYIHNIYAKRLEPDSAEYRITDVWHYSTRNRSYRFSDKPDYHSYA